MFPFLVTADWHIGRNSYGSISTTTGFHTHSHQLIESIRQLLSYATQSNITNVFVIGDVFHKRNPGSIDWAVFSTILSMFQNAEITLYVSPGNHDDLTTYTTALAPLDNLSNRYIKYIPSSEIFVDEELDIEIYVFSFTSKRWADNLSFAGVVDRLPEKTRKRVCLCHETLDGASANGASFSSGVTKSVLRSKFDLVISGHIHQQQEVSENIFHCGTITHLDFGDRDTVPGFSQVNVNLSVDHIPVITRKFRQIEGSVKQILKQLDERSAEFIGDVTKLVITDKATTLSMLQDKLNPYSDLDLVVESHPISDRIVRTKLKTDAGTLSQYDEYTKGIDPDITILGRNILLGLTNDS